MFDKFKKKVSEKFGNEARKAIVQSVKDKVKKGPSDSTLELVGMCIGLYTPIASGYVTAIKDIRAAAAETKALPAPVTTTAPASSVLMIDDGTLKTIIETLVKEGAI